MTNGFRALEPLSPLSRGNDGILQQDQRALAMAVLSDALDIIPSPDRLPPPPPPPGMLPLPPARPPPIPKAPLRRPEVPCSVKTYFTPQSFKSIPENIWQAFPGPISMILAFGKVLFPDSFVQSTQLLPMDIMDDIGDLASGFAKDMASEGVERGREGLGDIARVPLEHGKDLVRSAPRAISGGLTGSWAKDGIDALTSYNTERMLGGSPEAELLAPIEQNLPIFPTHTARVMLQKAMQGGQNVR